jgi:hypothetical protein
MYRSSQAKKKFGQITWLMLGIFFVLLYSCPVKKFIILVLDKTQPGESANAQFMKAYSVSGGKIAYLHKDACVYTVAAPGRSIRPADPLHVDYLPPAYAASGTEPLRGGIQDRSANDRNFFTIGPPRYLQLLRLRL